jgi:hypothetical protein
VNDPDEDDIYLYVDWGDQCPAINWTGPYTSGQPIELNHIFENQGDYTIGAQAKDIYDEEGPWGYLDISMPYNYHLSLTHTIILRVIYKIMNLIQ